MIDDCYVNKLAKVEVCVVFHSRVICRSVSPNYEDAILVTLGGTQTKVTETSAIEFYYLNEKLLL